MKIIGRMTWTSIGLAGNSGTIGGKFERWRLAWALRRREAGGSVVMRVDDGGDKVQVWRSMPICGARRVDGTVRGFVSSIFAVAEEAGARAKGRERNPKRMGELSQAAFLVKAQSLGFGLALPWGDSEKYDFVVWARPGGRLLRVQVKATGRLNRGGYDVQPVYSTRGEGKKIYTAEDIDVLAAHVVLEEVLEGKDGKDVWYLLPVEAFAGVKSLRLFPDLKSRNPRWEGYRESWEWLGAGVGARRRKRGR